VVPELEVRVSASLMIGCPVAHRAWVLDRWFDHIEMAAKNAFVEPEFVFVGDPKDRSFEVIRRRAGDFTLVEVPNGKGDDTRVWNQDRYRVMVDLRNRLLGAVRDLQPDYFLSLDSDILLHPFVLDSLLDDMAKDTYDAVGAKTYMTQTGTNCPSWARLSTRGDLQRYDTEGYFPCQVIMAVKMMRASAYGVDYELHVQGEDIGWSLACQRAGLKLAWDGRYGSKHVLAPHMLHCRDPRVGF
jgi:hypothetical protein